MRFAMPMSRHLRAAGRAARNAAWPAASGVRMARKPSRPGMALANATRTIIDKPLSKYPYPIPSREEILGVLRTSDASLAANDIAEALSIKRQEREGFFRRVAAMERDGQIRLDKRGHYQLTHPSNFVAGRVQGHRDGYGFLIRDDGQDDLFLPNGEMQKVMHNDRVLARIVGYDRLSLIHI